MADTPDELLEEIAANAGQPQSVSVDGQSMSMPSLADQMDFYREWKRQRAASKPARGLRFTKLLPPGAV